MTALPKGLPTLPPTAEPAPSPPTTWPSLERENYLLALYQALAPLPFELVRCAVLEQAGQPPEIQLILRAVR